MPAPDGFTWTTRKNGDVVISHRGRVATTLRGDRAREFVASVDDDEASAANQELMARLTGNYKRGNERDSRNHPRNRGRR